MNLQPRTWALISILSLIGAAICWRLGERHGQPAPGPVAPVTNTAPAPQSLTAPQPAGAALASPSPAQPVPMAAPAAVEPEPFPYRLRNTPDSMEQLVRNTHAILLRNALLDTRGARLPDIPAALRAEGDPGSYIVQARGPLNEVYRRQVVAAGGRVVAYVPNNAWLVRTPAEGAARLAALPETQSVLPFEPYYKLEPELLALAVEGKPLWDDTKLNLLLFPEEGPTARAALAQLGLAVLAEERNPFGPVLTVQPEPGCLTALARLGSVQAIESFREPAPANDLSRWRTGVSPNSVVTTNHLGLTGTNVTVAVVEGGIWAQHPDLVGHVIGPATNDPSGHGTHVAGIIVSSGANGPVITTSRLGSTNGAKFRGMAPGATLVATPRSLSDAAIQEMAALSNAFICNNSWTYGGGTYDTHAASFDAAVRDSVPGLTGPQSVCYVFAAGNGGGALDSGFGGQANSIDSPATAKNVITVGATELPRGLTNVVHQDCANTNAISRPWAALTDSFNQVARFSGRGNVAPGIEGPNGRFKPDVVAPGAMVVSCAVSNYQYPSNFTSVRVGTYLNRTVPPGGIVDYSLPVPINASFISLQILTNRFSPRPWPGLPISTHFNAVPGPGDQAGVDRVDMVPSTNGTLFYSISNPSAGTVTFDLRTEVTLTNCAGDYFDALHTNDLALDATGKYRFESGTSQSAAVVSGLLALMQERLATLGLTNPSPALYKAMLINGAQSLGSLYNLGVHQAVTHQGWGIANLTNTLPAAMTASAGPVRFFDQSASNVLATGETHLRTVVPSGLSRRYPLRITLVWTDPPGNPAASLKLVNDLDLVVTDLDTGEVLVGNNFAEGSDFTRRLPAANRTNVTLALDPVNNVENVYIAPVGGFLSVAGYSVAVHARRVSVNAVHARPDGIYQDYALVISSGNPLLAAPFTVSPTATPTVTYQEEPPVTAFTSNGVPVLYQRVGANPPLLVYTNGMTNQWNFFIFTNTTTFTNVAIMTFLPPNLSIPRNYEADLDLYVSTAPNGLAITNLDAAILAGAQKSLGRLGTELVVYSNSTANAIYYIGVKSEDQMAAQYSIVALASEKPFSNQDSNGVVTVEFQPLPADIPDGSPDAPGGTNLIGICLSDLTIQRAVVESTIFHEEIGDLFGALSHSSGGGQGEVTGTEDTYVVLNNHRLVTNSALVSWLYDDSNYGDSNYVHLTNMSAHTDGPGSLNDFVGKEAAGVWFFSVVDSALLHTGRVVGFTVTLEPQSTNDDAVSLRWNNIQPNTMRVTLVQVPLDATNMQICVDATGPVNLYVRHGLQIADTNTLDLDVYFTSAGCTNIDLYSAPPLLPGVYYIGIFNPNPSAVDAGLTVRIERDLRPGATTAYDAGAGRTTVLDDAVTNATLLVTNHALLADLRVGVRIDHPRASDLSLSVVSPNGSRVLLAENRGRTSTLGYGLDNTNFGWYSPYYPMPVNTFSEVHLIDESFEQVPPLTYLASPRNYLPSFDFERFGGWRVLTNFAAVLRLPPESAVSAFDRRQVLQLTDNTGVALGTAGAIGPGWYRFNLAATAPSDQAGLVTNDVRLVTLQTSPTGLPLLVTNDLVHLVISPLNSPTNLQWFLTQLVFRVTSPVQSLQLLSTNASVGVVVPTDTHPRILLDSVRLDPLNDPFDESFESVAPGVYAAGASLQFPNRVLNTWTVDSGDIQLVASERDFHGPAHTGFQALALNGTNGSGTISTLLPTTPGHFYQLTFATTKSPATTNTLLAEARVYEGGGRLFTLGLTNSQTSVLMPWPILTNVVWETNWLVFRAAATNTQFQLASLSSGTNGLWVDTVRLVEITDPAGVEFLRTWLQPYRYAYFAEGAERATLPIKFAEPPFCSTNTEAQVLASLFENIVPGDFPPGMVVDGWDVLSNSVDVVGTPSALSGSNVLQFPFDNGVIQRVLPTRAGHLYRLTYSYRAPETWETGNAVADPSFELHSVPGSGILDCPTGDLTPWVLDTNQVAIRQSGTCLGFTADSGNLALELNGNSQSHTGLGQIHQDLAATVAARQYNLSFAFAANVCPGVWFQAFEVAWNARRLGTIWMNALDPGWQRTNFVVTALGNDRLTFTSLVDGNGGPLLDTVSAISSAVRGSGEMRLLGLTNRVLAPQNYAWRTDSQVFIAPTNGTVLQFAESNPFLELDSVLLLELGDFNLPEEPLKPLYGQDAFGPWRLEVWDNRASAAVSNGVVLGWELDMAFSRTNAPITLVTNGGSYTNVIAADSFTYFLVNLSCSGSTATNVLFNTVGPVDVWLNNRVPPTGQLPDDVLLDSGTTGGVYLLEGGLAPLTGQDYFLGIYSATSNSIQFQATWDSPCLRATSWTLSPAASGFSGGAFRLAWSGPAGHAFVVEYSDTVPPVWKEIPGPVTVTPSGYSFADDGSLTGGLSSTRFYRLRVK